MAASSNTSKYPSSTLSSTPPSTASARLEKSHPGVRRSTPDSEALASSDDDAADAPMTQTITAPAIRPARRTSWLNEIPLSVQRKHSLPGGPLSSAPSNPTSPAADQAPWSANPNSGISGSFNWNQTGSSFPWGTGIWNSESRKEPPSRLSEIVPSPTMSNPPQSAGGFGDEMLSPITRTVSGESAIPFSIPLHPTPKTYRSQSYSVGQMEPEVLSAMAKTAASAQYPTSRARPPGQASAVQHRGSRSSVLGELGHDPALLGRVREDEGAEEGLGGPEGDINYSASQARTIEQLARENALLRQAAASQMDARLRDRASSSASGAGGHSIHRIRGGVPEEELSPDEYGEIRDIPGYAGMRSNTGRRFSEHSPNLEQQLSSLPPSLENRALDTVRKAHWQSSLGFGGMAEISQSRRHSFAEIPMRHGSVSSIDSQNAATPRAVPGDRDDGYENMNDFPNPSMQQPFYGRDQTLRGDGSSGIPSALNQYAMSGAFSRQPPALSHAHQNQLLYIVTFKCHRADVFYIQEDTGLQVKAGDLVIVEADRGTDLGTVQHANVSLQRARELKQQYAEEHYKWLMMFSRQNQLEGSDVASPGAGLPARSATGGMGPHGHGVQEPPTDIKPKLIKRLAQNHEILNLRDKEGNEAKAKRVCHQKVAEHRLNMEILDAEFQMDWKKLTFYYFANTYINFNSLVTDLFKIYKTRIWMSAINPASFVTPPSAGLPGPGISNPLYSQEVQNERRHPHEGRPYGATRDTDPGREPISSPVGMLRTAFTESYQPFAQPQRHVEVQPDPFAPYSPTSYGPLETGFSDYPANSNGPPRMHPAQGEWVTRFQGLSLNS